MRRAAALHAEVLASEVILIAAIATILLSVIWYAAFKLRDKRRSRSQTEKPVFFHRYRAGGGDARGRG